MHTSVKAGTGGEWVVCPRSELHPEKGEDIFIDGRTSLSLTLSAHHNMQKAAPQNPASTAATALLFHRDVRRGVGRSADYVIQCLRNLGTDNEVLKVSTEKK